MNRNAGLAVALAGTGLLVGLLMFRGHARHWFAAPFFVRQAIDSGSAAVVALIVALVGAYFFLRVQRS